MLQTKLCGNVNICRLEWRIFIEDIDDWYLLLICLLILILIFLLILILMIDYSQNCLVTSILAADERTPPMRITTWEKEQLITWNWNLNSSSSVFTRDGHAPKFAYMCAYLHTYAHICALSASFRISRIRMALVFIHPQTILKVFLTSWRIRTRMGGSDMSRVPGSMSWRAT